MEPISETEARSALLRQKSEASNPEFFDAKRRAHGWVFGWRDDSGSVPMGTHTWIVADNGGVRMLGYTDLWDETIASALTE